MTVSKKNKQALKKAQATTKAIRERRRQLMKEQPPVQVGRVVQGVRVSTIQSVPKRVFTFLVPFTIVNPGVIARIYHSEEGMAVFEVRVNGQVLGTEEMETPGGIKKEYAGSLNEGDVVEIIMTSGKAEELFLTFYGKLGNA